MPLQERRKPRPDAFAAPRHVAGQQQLHAIDEPPPRVRGATLLRGARTEAAAHQRQREAFGFERLDAAGMQAVAQQRDQRLRTRVDAQRLAAESRFIALGEQPGRCQLSQQRRRKREHETVIAAGDRVADLVALPRIEEQHVVGIRDGLVVADMPQVDPAVRENQMRRRGALLRAAVAAGAQAMHVPHRHGAGVEQPGDLEIAHRRQFIRAPQPGYREI